MIADYMKNKSIESNKVEMISHPKAKFKSFKITVSKDSLSFILSDNFLPNDIKCKIWRMIMLIKHIIIMVNRLFMR